MNDIPDIPEARSIAARLKLALLLHVIPPERSPQYPIYPERPSIPEIDRIIKVINT